MAKFKEDHPNQIMLMPPSLEDKDGYTLPRQFSAEGLCIKSAFSAVTLSVAKGLGVG